MAKNTRKGNLNPKAFGSAGVKGGGVRSVTPKSVKPRAQVPNIGNMGDQSPTGLGRKARKLR